MKMPIYLDNHSTTPLDPRVLQAMMPYLTTEFGNPSSKSHPFGWRAEHGLEKSREQVARLIGATSREIIFTSGSTEANNIALGGLAPLFPGGHLIVSDIEHKCVRETAKALEKRGYSVTFLPVDSFGQVQASQLENALRPDTFLLSIMLANNEVGTINPIAEIGRIAKKRGIFFHCDAAQAVGKISVNVDELGVDLLSLSAHKFYGPKGVGALYMRRKNPRVELQPTIFGGGQEAGLRSGTHNVPGIVGLGAACELASADGLKEHERVQILRDKLWNGLFRGLDGSVLLNGHPMDRLPGSLNVSFPFVESDSLVARLTNIAVSSTSACLSAGALPSFVLTAMGLPTDRIHSSIRIGLGRFTTEEEIDYTISSMVETVKEIREASPLYQLSKGT